MSCPCDCHGHGTAHQPACSIPGGCGHLHRDCPCGRPVEDVFLCQACTDQLALDLEALSHFLPELTVVLARQQRTTDNRSRRAIASRCDEALGIVNAPLPTRKLTASEASVGLVATPLMYDPAASALLAEARNTIGTWCRHLCETRGITLDRILEAV